MRGLPPETRLTCRSPSVCRSWTFCRRERSLAAERSPGCGSCGKATSPGTLAVCEQVRSVRVAPLPFPGLGGPRRSKRTIFCISP